MPIVNVGGGKAIRFPDDMSQEDIIFAIQTMDLPEGGPLSAATDVLKAVVGGGLTQVGSGLAGAGRAGWEASPLKSAIYGEDIDFQEAALKGAETVQDVQQAVSPYTQPSTQAGASALRAIGRAFEPVTSKFQETEQTLGDIGYELGGPSAGAVGYALPTAVLEAIGYGALRKLIPNVRFLDDAGNPTPELITALNKAGLSWDDLEQAAKAKVPTLASRGVINPAPDVQRSLEPVRAAQISGGGTEAALAPYSAAGERVVPDYLGEQAVKQWDDPGLIQSVKQSNPETKALMQQQMDVYRRAKGNNRVLARPLHIAGQSAVSRIEFVAEKANEARKELDRIANNKLAGAEIDPTPIVRDLFAELADLDIRIDASGGIPKPVFTGSIISQDKTSQAIIKKLFSLLSEGGKPDALRFHKIKRQIDALVDYSKKSPSGLADIGSNVLKGTRANLNKALRAYDEDYARVNDILSESLTLFDDLDSISGSRTSIFEPNAGNKLGREFRKIYSNYGVSDDMVLAIENLSSVASKYGYPKNDDTIQLVNFAIALDSRFGTLQRTSFKGEIGDAIKRQQQAEKLASAASSGAGRGSFKVMEAMAGAYDAARGVNDERAYGIMEALLKRNGQ